MLATLFKVEGSAPRGPGAQMLFDRNAASGYFSGDCIEGDVAAHAAEVLADGQPQVLHYGMGSPWIDIRLRCGGALHVLVERIAADSAAADLNRSLLPKPPPAGASRRCHQKYPNPANKTTASSNPIQTNPSIAQLSLVCRQ